MPHLQTYIKERGRWEDIGSRVREARAKELLCLYHQAFPYLDFRLRKAGLAYGEAAKP